MTQGNLFTDRGAENSTREGARLSSAGGREKSVRKALVGNKAGRSRKAQVTTIAQLCRAPGGRRGQASLVTRLLPGRSTARSAPGAGCRPSARGLAGGSAPATQRGPPTPRLGPAPWTPRPCRSGKGCPPRPLTGGDAQLLGAPAEALHHLPAAEVRQVPHGGALRR